MRELFPQPAVGVGSRRDAFGHGVAGATLVGYFDPVKLHRAAGIKALHQSLLDFAGNPPVNGIELPLIGQHQGIDHHLVMKRHQLFVVDQKRLMLQPGQRVFQGSWHHGHPDGRLEGQQLRLEFVPAPSNEGNIVVAENVVAVSAALPRRLQ